MQKLDPLQKKVMFTIKRFNLLTKKDIVLVACSGGKDSTTILYILKQLGYDPEAIAVDASIGEYTKINIDNLKLFCKELDVKLHIISFKDEFNHSLIEILNILKKKNIHLNSCTICGVLRRYILNKYARKLKATKLVTGHNLNDEAQAVVMNLLKNNVELLARQGPITGINKSKKFIPRIKPLYFVPEKDIESYSKKNNFPVNYESCPCRVGVYRCLINEQLTKMENKKPKTHKNIINWFLSISPKLKEEFRSDEEQSYCKNCGEPARKDKCMTCQILENI